MAVPDEERLSRFIFSKNWFSRLNSRVKPDAFFAAPYQELSVGCTSGLNEGQTWDLGKSFAELSVTPKAVLARADISAQSVRSVGLEIDRDDKPFRHANIKGWPGTSREEQRDLAVRLAAKALLVPRHFENLETGVN